MLLILIYLKYKLTQVNLFLILSTFRSHPASIKLKSKSNLLVLVFILNITSKDTLIKFLVNIFVTQSGFIIKYVLFVCHLKISDKHNRISTKNKQSSHI